MCLIVLAYRVNSIYPLIMAANRDEFYDRPSAPADFWSERPDILAGRDLKEGGTWCGVTKGGKFAALTNFRDPLSVRAGAPSRGNLVRRYLEGDYTAEEFLGFLRKEGSAYNGFSIIFGTVKGLFYYSNRGAEARIVPGIHGLSNALLGTPWPKVNRGIASMTAVLNGGSNLDVETFFAFLRDETKPADDELPDTGVGYEWERILSSVFIRSPIYGTRSSTVIMLVEGGGGVFVERSLNGLPDAWMTRVFHWVADNG